MYSPEQERKKNEAMSEADRHSKMNVIGESTVPPQMLKKEYKKDKEGGGYTHR